jgi:hypothetical protein
MDFTTPANVMKFLNKTALTAQESAIVDMLIKSINGVINNYCGWDVLAKDYTNKVFDGKGGKTLDLRALPLNSLTSLVIGDIDYTADVTLNNEDGELYFTSESGISFTSGTRNIVVTYNAGFTVVPDELDHVAAWLVALFFNRIKLENIGVAEERFNDIEVKYDSTDLPVLVKHTLDRYRRVGIF